MSAAWSPDELTALERAEELLVAARRPDGTLRRAVPVWVVRVGEDALLRTWHRRETGWYGAAARSGRARVQVPGVAGEVEVDVEVVGAGGPALREGVDAAYRGKYGPGGSGRMVGDEAAATTLRLRPAARPDPRPAEGGATAAGG